MKNLILLTALFFTTVATAEMPKYLEGAEIKVTLKNGKTYTYKAEEHAVIPRSSMGKTAALESTVKRFKKKIENEEIVENKKNRIYGLVGRGLTGDSKARTNGKRYTVEQEEGAVLGLGYQRKVNDNFNLGIQIQNNKTTSFTLGKDF